MATIQELLARAAALREETALNSISPERAGGIMYDTIMAINELWLQQGSALVISKIYTSVASMEADDEPVSDISGQPLRAGQIVVIASSDSDNGSVYRFGGISEGSSVWALVGTIGNLTPVDALDSDSTQLPLAAHQGKVLDGKISQLGQKVESSNSPLYKMYFVGRGNTFVNSLINSNFLNGHKYRVYVNPNIEMSGVTVGDTFVRFELLLKNGASTVRTLIEVLIADELQEYYDIEIPLNITFDSLVIGGRCADGAQFNAYFEDISGLSSLRSIVTPLENNEKSVLNYEEGYYLGKSGDNIVEVEDANAIVSDLIPVHGISTILWKSGVANSNYKLVCYAEDGTTVTDYWSSYSAGDNECEIDLNTYFVRASCGKNADAYVKDKSDGSYLWTPEFGAKACDYAIKQLNKKVDTLNTIVTIINDNVHSDYNYKKGYYLGWSNGAAIEVAQADSIYSDLIPVHGISSVLWKSNTSNSSYKLILYGKDGVTPVFEKYYSSYNADQNTCLLNDEVYFLRASAYGDSDCHVKNAVNGDILWSPKFGVESCAEKISQLKEQVKENSSAIEVINEELDGNDVVLNNKDMLVSIQAAGARPEGEYYADVATQYKNNRLLPVFAIITDAHAESVYDLDNIKRSFKFTDAFDEIDATFGLGDIADNGTIFKAIDWNALESSYVKPILFIPGNHEAYMGWNSNPPTNATEADIMNGWFTEALIERNGENHPTISDEVKSYWYRDFSKTDAKDGKTRKLRVVGLNCYTIPSPDAPLGFSQEQLNWLIDLLENEDSETYTVIINHEPISTLLKANRYTEVFNMPSYSRFNQADRSHNVIAEFVNAWKHRQNLNIEYKGNTYTHNFANASGNFVCYITGHEHVDGVYKHQTYADQVEVNLNCAASKEKFQSSDLPRVDGTRTQDCITLFSYDWYNNRINLLRIGSNVTTAMRERKYDNIGLL